MHNFLTLGYLSYKALFAWWNWWAYTSNILLRPMLTVVIFGLAGRFVGDPARVETYIIGVAASSIPLIMLGGTLQTFANDRAWHTLAVVFGTPVNRFELYWSRGYIHYPNGIVTFAVSVLFGWLLLGLNLAEVNWVSLSGAALLIAASSMAFSLFIGNFAIVFSEWLNLRAIGVGLLMTSTGIVIPISDLPGFLGGLSFILPVTHGLVALRAAFHGVPIEMVGVSLLAEGFIALGYGIVGYVTFHLLEAKAKDLGALDPSVA